MSQPSINLTATLQSISGVSSTGSKLKISLVGYGSATPTIYGETVLSPLSQIVPFTGATVSIPLYGNNAISPAGTTYLVQFIDPNGNVASANEYQLVGSGTLDLSIVPAYNTSAGSAAQSVIYTLFAQGVPAVFAGNWSEGTVYSTGEVVYYANTRSSYASLANSNGGHEPDSSPTWWGLTSAGAPPATFGGAWSPDTTYGTGVIVSFTDGASYVSLQAGNTGNVPGAGSAFWGVLNPATQVPAVIACKSVTASSLLLAGGSGGARKLPTNSKRAWVAFGPAINDLRLWMALDENGNDTGLLYGPKNLLPVDAAANPLTNETFFASRVSFAKEPQTPSTRNLGTYSNYGVVFGSVAPNGAPRPGLSWVVDANGNGQIVSDTNLVPDAPTQYVIAGMTKPPIVPAPLTNFATGQVYNQFAAGAVAAMQKIYVGFDGQSLATGGDGNPILSSVQPFSAKMIGPAVRTRIVANATLGSNTLQPLIEADGVDTGNGGGMGETPCSGFANALTAFVQGMATLNPSEPASISPIIGNFGIGGTVYAGLAGPTDYTADHVNGSPSFQEGKAELKEAVRLQPGTTVPAFIFIHGEFDGLGGAFPNPPYYNTNYEANNIQLQKDYQAMAQPITGQTGSIPMILVSNINTATGFQQFNLIRQNTSLFFMSDPAYQYQHETLGTPGFTYAYHMTPYSYRLRGEYLAQTFRRILFERRQWLPTMPYKIQTGVTTTLRPCIILDYVTPYGDPITLDNTSISDPGNYGFVVTDTQNINQILSVVQTAPNQLTLYLARPLTPTGRTLWYAFDQSRLSLESAGNGLGLSLTNQLPAGTVAYSPIAGARGCVRDNPDVPRMSYYPVPNTNGVRNHDGALSSVPLWNYCPPFMLSI